MVSTVAAERSKLHDRYPPLRLRILEHYRTMVELTGRSVDGRTYKLPHKLGHWGPQHSARVRAACPELADVVASIEALRAARAPALIAARHIQRRPVSRHNRATWAKVARDQDKKDLAALKSEL